MKKKKLERRQENRMVAGVLSGLAHYFDQDPTLFRVLAITFLIFTGFFPGLLIYVAAWITMPVHNSKDDYVDYEIVE